MSPPKNEIRFEIDAEELAVLDGYCAGTGKNRTEVIRELLQEFSSRQLHVAIMVCRVAQVNPITTESSRSGEGKA